MSEPKQRVWNAEMLSGPFLGGTLAGLVSALMVHPRLGLVFGVATFALLVGARVFLGNLPADGEARLRARPWIAGAFVIVMVALVGALILRLSRTSPVLPAPPTPAPGAQDASSMDSDESVPDIQEFLAWVNDVETRLAELNALGGTCTKAGMCSANLARDSGAWIVQYARERPSALRFSASFPGRIPGCGAFGEHTVERKWSYASVAKTHCKLASLRQVVIEQQRESVKVLLFTSAYLEHDPDFARVVRDQGTGF